MRALFALIFGCQHPNWGFQQHGRETCTSCGTSRVAPLKLTVNPRFDVPRYQPKAREATALERFASEIEEINDAVRSER